MMSKSTAFSLYSFHNVNRFQVKWISIIVHKTFPLRESICLEFLKIRSHFVKFMMKHLVFKGTMYTARSTIATKHRDVTQCNSHPVRAETWRRRQHGVR